MPSRGELLRVARPLPGEEEAETVLRVLASGHLPHEESVAAFEQRFAGVRPMQDGRTFMKLLAVLNRVSV